MANLVYNVVIVHQLLIFLKKFVLPVLLILISIMHRKSVCLILIIQIGLMLIIFILRMGHSLRQAMDLLHVQPILHILMVLTV